MTINLSPDLALPDDFVTQPAGIMARRGAGKTYTALVLAEELIANSLPVALLDPLGVCWGLRASADGKKAGLAVTALITYGPRSRTVLAFLAGYSQKSSGYANALGALRAQELITKAGDPIGATDAGMALLAGQVDPPATGAELYTQITGRLGKAERAVLEAVLAADPRELTRDELAFEAGYSPTSSGYANALGRLRSLELLVGLRASDELLEAIR